MATKRTNGLIDLGQYDPLVEELLNESGKRQRKRRMPVGERKAAAREKAKMEKRADRRVGYDLDPEVISEVALLAAQNSATASSLANLALHLFLEAVHGGNIDLTTYRRLAKPNPRYEHIFVFEKKDENLC